MLRWLCQLFLAPLTTLLREACSGALRGHWNGYGVAALANSAATSAARESGHVEDLKSPRHC